MFSFHRRTSTSNSMTTVCMQILRISLLNDCFTRSLCNQDIIVMLTATVAFRVIDPLIIISSVWCLHPLIQAVIRNDHAAWPGDWEDHDSGHLTWKHHPTSLLPAPFLSQTCPQLLACVQMSTQFLSPLKILGKRSFVEDSISNRDFTVVHYQRYWLLSFFRNHAKSRMNQMNAKSF